MSPGHGFPRVTSLVLGCLLLATIPGVCLAQTTPSIPPQYADRIATLVKMSGRVSVLKDNIPWVLEIGSTIVPRQTVITGEDGYALFQLPDGSTFEVFQNSNFVYRATPSNLEDLIDMVLGKVKVHIEKRFGGKPNPNKIRTPTAVISVRGTTYWVEMEDEGNTTLVRVDEGIVDVQHVLMPYGEPRHLQANEYIRVYKNQPLAQKSVDRDSLIRRGLNAAYDAIWVIANSPRGGSSPTGGSGGGGTKPLPGDTGGSKDPPPPPPPPPPPAP